MPILKKRVKTRSKIKQQQQTLITSKNLSASEKQNLITKSKLLQIKLTQDKIT